MRQLKVLLLIIAAAALQSCVVADRDRDRIAGRLRAANVDLARHGRQGQARRQGGKSARA